ncbi:MAG: hypothetical protein WDN31_02325 [Hyphomicrobium sp.]
MDAIASVVFVALSTSPSLAQRHGENPPPGHAFFYTPNGEPPNDPSVRNCHQMPNGVYDCMGTPDEPEPKTARYLAYVRVTDTIARKLGVANAYEKCGLGGNWYSPMVGLLNRYLHTSAQTTVLGEHLTAKERDAAEKRMLRVGKQAERALVADSGPIAQRQCKALRARLGASGYPF